MKYSTKQQIIFLSLASLVVFVVYLLQRYNVASYFKGAYILIFAIIPVLLYLSFKTFFNRWFNFFEGQCAEDEVDDLLNELPQGYRHISDVTLCDRGNIDSIVIGPTGIFTLEVKSHRGRIGFNGRELTRGWRKFEKDFLSQAYSEAMTIRDLIRDELNLYLKVEPVIVFTRARVRFGKRNLRGVYVIGYDWVKDFIFESQNDLDGDMINKVYDLIQEKKLNQE